MNNERLSRPALVSFLHDLKNDTSARYRSIIFLIVIIFAWAGDSLLFAIKLASYAGLVLSSVAFATDCVFILKKKMNKGGLQLFMLLLYSVVALSSVYFIDRAFAVFVLLCPGIMVAILMWLRIEGKR